MPGRQKKPTLRSQPLPRQEVNVTIQHLPEEQHQQQQQQQQHNHNRITNIHYV
jgi:ribosomal protein S10